MKSSQLEGSKKDNENNKVLVLFAHPTQEQSEINIHLYNKARQLPGVSTVDLYAEYPNHHIDVDKEQERMKAHEVVVFLFPLYWYSTPAILKDWLDLVLEYNFAYGHDGKVLKGKSFLCALTAGGTEKAYDAEGYNHFTLRELLRPLEQTARFCGMHFLAPFALFCARRAKDENRIQAHIDNWEKLLIALVNQQLNIEKAKAAELLLPVLDDLL